GPTVEGADVEAHGELRKGASGFYQGRRQPRVPLPENGFAPDPKDHGRVRRRPGLAVHHDRGDAAEGSRTPAHGSRGLGPSCRSRPARPAALRRDLGPRVVRRSSYAPYALPHRDTLAGILLPRGLSEPG